MGFEPEALRVTSQLLYHLRFYHLSPWEQRVAEFHLFLHARMRTGNSCDKHA